MIAYNAFGFAKGDVLTNIDVSLFKSSFIYFDDQVVSIDLGMNESYDATFEKNFVRITAIKQLADYQTNLTVTTKTGIYAFLINYKDNPDQLYYFPEDFKALRKFSAPIASAKDINNDKNQLGQSTDKVDELGHKCKDLGERKVNYPVAAFSKAKVQFAIDQIYISDNKFFLKIVAQNQSNIDFDVDFVKFQIKNKKTIKRSSQQEVYIEPIFVYNKMNKLKANSTEMMVCVVDKFTIMSDKKFVVQIQENGGERNMSFEVPNSQILGAKEL